MASFVTTVVALFAIAFHGSRWLERTTSPATARFLMRVGAWPDRQAIEHHIREGHDAILATIADVRPQDFEFYERGELLVLAVLSGHRSTVELFLDHHHDPNWVGRTCTSAYQVALALGRFDIVAAFLARGPVDLDPVRWEERGCRVPPRE